MKKKHLSKEQAQQDILLRKEVDRKRAVAKDGIYPILLDESKSIEDAKMMCESMAIGIKQMFNNRMKDVKLSELNMSDMLNKNDPHFNGMERMIKLLNEENLRTATELLEGMSRVIESFQREESTKRELSSLTTDFL